jgi:hypothetical protein
LAGLAIMREVLYELFITFVFICFPNTIHM